MALLKLGRESFEHKQDNLLDAAGYIGLAEDLPEPDIELDAEDKISALQMQVETLEKEADWITGHVCYTQTDSELLCPPRHYRIYSCAEVNHNCPKCWRDTARNTATQHTLAVLALTMTQICLETYKPDPNTYMAEQCANLQRYLDAASEQTKRKKLSAGASRALNRVIEHISPYIEHDKNLDGNALFARWAALVWAASTFVDDACIVCKAYSNGPHKDDWRSIPRTMTSLAKTMMTLEPGIDEEGTTLYERAAWALEGVDFDPAKEAA